MRAASLTYRPDIDGLRGVAVALVIAYHAFPRVRTGGFIGVDVFFVISGYLITQLVLTGLKAGTFSLAEFYRRRVRRIVPALLAVMAACCIFGWLTLLPSELQWLGRSVSWCASFLANMFFSTTGGYFDRAAVLNPLLHLWSLGVEEQFYLIWPVLLIIATKYGATMRVLVALTATSLAISIWGAWYAPIAHFYLPGSRVWELAVGGLLAAWQLRRSGRLAKHASSIGSRRFWRGSEGELYSLLGVALIVAGGLLWTGDKAVPGMWSAIPTAGAALVIAAGPAPLLNRSLLGSRPMTFVGRISYPLYLWHWPAFSFARIIFGHAPRAAMTTVAIVLAFAAACATYRLVEVPIRYGELGRKAVPALLAGLAGLALLGMAAGARWIPGRLSGPGFSAWDEAVTDWRYPGESTFDKRSGFATLVVPSERDIKALFVGDSHMQQYWPRVADVIDTHRDSARSALFATRAGCPPLPGVESEVRGRNCHDLFAYAMERALQSDVDTVVLGAFWEEYFLGEYGVDDSRRRLYSVADPARQTLALASPGTELALEQLQRTVSRLASSGRRVFIVLSNPTSPLFDPLFPPAIRLSLHPARSFRLDAGPRVDAAPFESFVAPLMGRLRTIAARAGAQVLDPRAALCAGTLCPASDADGLPLYLDSNHLGASAARTRASFVDEILLGPETQRRAARPP